MNTTRLVIKLAFLGCLFYAGDRALSQDWAERCRIQLDGDHCASRLLELRRVIGRWCQTGGGVVLP